MSQIFNVLIIGAGNIGAFYDRPTTSDILTHAHAFTKYKGYNLIGFVDKDIKKAQKAISIWGGKAFKNINEAFKSSRIDIAVVAVPDDFHFFVLKQLSLFPIRLVFAEKPFTKSVSESEKIIKIYKTNNIAIAVNYSRRFVPEFEVLRNNINKGEYGKYITGYGYYGKGILHNGVHMIDLLRYLIREVKDIKIVDKIYDYKRDDPSVSAVLTCNNKPFFLQAVDSRLFTIFEMDLLFEKKRIRIIDSGNIIEEYSIKESTTYRGYKNLVKTREINTSLNRALYFASANIYKYLITGESLKCKVEEAYRTEEICAKISKANE